MRVKIIFTFIRWQAAPSVSSCLLVCHTNWWQLEISACFKFCCFLVVTASTTTGLKHSHTIIKEVRFYFHWSILHWTLCPLFLLAALPLPCLVWEEKEKELLWTEALCPSQLFRGIINYAESMSVSRRQYAFFMKLLQVGLVALQSTQRRVSSIVPFCQLMLLEPKGKRSLSALHHYAGWCPNNILPWVLPLMCDCQLHSFVS